MKRASNVTCGVALLTLSTLASNVLAEDQNSTTKFEYDRRGDVIKVTDPMDHATTFDHDALARTTVSTDANSKVTRYAYDGQNQLIQVTDARNVVTNYAIDGLGNLSQTTSADTGVTSNTYDDAGNVLTRTDAKLQRTTFKYDVLGRVTLVTYADNATVVYQYDQGSFAIGRLNRITDNGGTIDYAFDQDGHVTGESRVIGGVRYETAYRYDDAGRLAGMRYPSGRTVDYKFDELGRINRIDTTMGAVVTPLVTLVSYQPFGPVKAVTFNNGQVVKRGYDLDGRTASFSLANKTMAVRYDPASRIIGIGDAANVASGNTYGYDELDRLTSFITPTAGQSYAYDAVGNRTKKTINSAVTTFGYAGPGNRLTQVGAQAISMDANGSITNKGNATFNYDTRGRMVSANTAIGLVTYTINSLGQRVRKVAPTATTVFHYDLAGKLIAESTTAGGITKTQEYVYLGDMPVAVLK